MTLVNESRLVDMASCIGGVVMVKIVKIYFINSVKYHILAEVTIQCNRPLKLTPPVYLLKQPFIFILCV